MEPKTATGLDSCSERPERGQGTACTEKLRRVLTLVLSVELRHSVHVLVDRGRVGLPDRAPSCERPEGLCCGVDNRKGPVSIPSSPEGLRGGLIDVQGAEGREVLRQPVQRILELL